MKEWKKRALLYNRYVRRQEKKAEARKKKEKTSLVDDMELYQYEQKILKERMGSKDEEGKDNPDFQSIVKRPEWPVPTLCDIYGVDMQIVAPIVQILQIAERFPRIFSYNSWRPTCGSIGV